MPRNRTYTIIFLLIVFFNQLIHSQPGIGVSVSAGAIGCDPATAVLNITGTTSMDSIVISWSSGEQNVERVDRIDSGEHHVRVYIRQKKNAVTIIKDTTLFFEVRNLGCTVGFPKYFSPNGDGYNDDFLISNTYYYPNFDLQIFNKWGQRIHHQQVKFEAWDGKWIGIDLPDGNYYYIFQYDSSNPKRIEKGDVTILR